MQDLCHLLSTQVYIWNTFPLVQFLVPQSENLHIHRNVQDRDNMLCIGCDIFLLCRYHCCYFQPKWSSLTIHYFHIALGSHPHFDMSKFVLFSLNINWWVMIAKNYQFIQSITFKVENSYYSLIRIVTFPANHISIHSIATDLTFRKLWGDSRKSSWIETVTRKPEKNTYVRNVWFDTNNANVK